MASSKRIDRGNFRDARASPSRVKLRLNAAEQRTLATVQPAHVGSNGHVVQKANDEEFSDFVSFGQKAKVNGTKFDIDLGPDVKSPTGVVQPNQISRQLEAVRGKRSIEKAQQLLGEWAEAAPGRNVPRWPSSESSEGTGTGSDRDPNFSPFTKGADSSEKQQYLERFLAQIYDRTSHSRSLDSDTFTETSFSESFLSFVNGSTPAHRSVFARSALCASDFEPDKDTLVYKLTEVQLIVKPRRDLNDLLRSLQAHAQHVSAQLVRQLRRRDHALQRRARYCDVISAIVQATSEHRSVDRNLKFTIEPQLSLGENAFGRWKETMKAVVRLPCGLPPDFRRRMWLALADSHVESIKIDWERTKRFAFNERQNPDDSALGLQIVKDLHRTGYSNFNGQDNEEDRAVLKRVLLGYARWNKHVGYCQGFNVIAALILDVVNRREDEALKVFIYLIDHVLPASFFNNNLTALAVEMAVFRDLLAIYAPELSRHLEKLQQRARDSNSGNNYEPPLTNVFTMQWFLTLFATCLPHDTVLRLWDVIMLEGCETLLRAALAVWSKLRVHLRGVQTADEFYCLMGSLSQRLLDNQILTVDELIRVMFNLCPSPIPNLAELREKYTYNITPFAPAAAQNNRAKKAAAHKPRQPHSAVDESAFGCFTAVFADVDPAADRRRPLEQTDISHVGLGAFADDDEARRRALATASYPDHFAERMSTDVVALRKQYERLTQRHRQANVIITSAHRRYRQSVTNGPNSPAAVPSTPTPAPPPTPPPYSNVINHLLLGSTALRNRNTSVSAPTADSRPTSLAQAEGNSEQMSRPLGGPATSTLSQRAVSLESLQTANQTPSTRELSNYTQTNSADCRKSRLTSQSMRELNKRGSSLDYPPDHVHASAIQQRRNSANLAESTSGVGNQSSLSVQAAADTSLDQKVEKNVANAAERGTCSNDRKESSTTPELTMQQRSTGYPQTHRGVDSRKSFNFYQPNPNSLQRIRKMNMNACLQRGYLADMHSVQQAQRRKLYS